MNLLLSVLGYWGPYILLVTTSFALMIYNDDYLKIYVICRYNNKLYRKIRNQTTKTKTTKTFI